MAKVERKQPIINEIAENVKDAESVVLVHFSGVTVETDTQLRKELREAGITYKVYKNTMMNFAFKGTACEPLLQHLEGPNAIAVSKDDATAAARIIAGYSKKVPTLVMLAGIVEGNYYDQEGMQELAMIPSREGLLGRLFGSMQSPIASLARVLKQVAEAKQENGAADSADETKAEKVSSAEETGKQAEATEKESE